MPARETDRDAADENQKQEESPFPPIFTIAGESDGEVGDGEFMSDMEYDEGDEFYEELGALVEGQEEEDLHTPDLTTDED
ncbi:MAG: hypothetical protein M5U01_31255 [Ardenticatenaceae bacterium]|nr:hypothetical protein [Ardenticatenaceae bacterium]HBY97841.1 hypothetical protein [Chloroflexota bacterium]